MGKDEGRIGSRRFVESSGSAFESTAVKLPSEVTGFKIEAAKPVTIDIIPYRVGRGNPHADEGELYFELTYWAHRNIGPNEDMVVCPAKTFGEKCPICQDAARMKRDPDADEKIMKTLLPKKRQLWNVIDRNNVDAGIQIWDISPFNFGDVLAEAIKMGEEDDGFEYFADPRTGFSLRVGFTEESMGGGIKFFKASGIQFKARAKPYKSNIVDSATCLEDLLIRMDYEKLRSLYYQEEVAKPGDEGATTRKKPATSFEDDGDDEEPAPKPKKKPPVEEEDEEEPAPKPKKKPVPVEDDDDEEPAPKPKKKPPVEEDDEEPAPKPKKKPPVEEDDEEEPSPKPKKKPPVEDDEEEEPKPKKKAKPADDDEDWADWE